MPKAEDSLLVMKMLMLRSVQNDLNFNCCFTVHFDKFKAFLPTDALVIKT
jgi:hypothetical protein